MSSKWGLWTARVFQALYVFDVLFASLQFQLAVLPLARCLWHGACQVHMAALTPSNLCL